ncbi:MAG: hypothetical protein MI863_26875 [Desulfobacterales bacterium]|nr:hypothetical protein [Desulfobacterales bacterium]
MARKAKKNTGPKLPKLPDPAVYIGPNMGGELPMTQFNVYRKGLPAPVKDRFESDPAFAKLFVPVADLAGARLKLKDPASDAAKAFRAVVKGQGR